MNNRELQDMLSNAGYINRSDAIERQDTLGKFARAVLSREGFTAYLKQLEDKAQLYDMKITLRNSILVIDAPNKEQGQPLFYHFQPYTIEGKKGTVMLGDAELGTWAIHLEKCNPSHRIQEVYDYLLNPERLEKQIIEEAHQLSEQSLNRVKTGLLVNSQRYLSGA